MAQNDGMHQLTGALSLIQMIGQVRMCKLTKQLRKPTQPNRHYQYIPSGLRNIMTGTITAHSACIKQDKLNFLRPWETGSNANMHENVLLG